MTPNEISLNTIKADHVDYIPLTQKAGWTTAIAVALLIGALIVAIAGGLCLSLKGVNAIKHVVLPAFLPASIAIIVSIPFFMRGKKHNDEAKPYRTRIIKEILSVVKSPEVSSKKKEELTTYLEKNLFAEYFETNKWDRNYVTKLITDIKAEFPKEAEERSPTDKTLFEALDEVMKNLNPKQRNKKKKDPPKT